MTNLKGEQCSKRSDSVWDPASSLLHQTANFGSKLWQQTSLKLAGYLQMLSSFLSWGHWEYLVCEHLFDQVLQAYLGLLDH